MLKSRAQGNTHIRQTTERYDIVARFFTTVVRRRRNHPARLTSGIISIPADSKALVCRVLKSRVQANTSIRQTTEGLVIVVRFLLQSSDEVGATSSAPGRWLSHPYDRLKSVPHPGLRDIRFPQRLRPDGRSDPWHHRWQRFRADPFRCSGLWF